MKKGTLIAFEEMDGSGKSTQAALLKLHLERFKVPCKIIKAKPKELDRAFKKFVDVIGAPNDSMAYMFAYQALHRIQYEKTMEAIAKGEVVISDRWNTSFFVYHNNFGPLSNKPKSIREVLDNLAFEELHPNFCFFLNVPTKVAFDRIIARGDRKSFSEEDHRFYESIRNEYVKIVKENNWIIINGNKSIDTIHKIVFRHLAEITAQ